MLFQHVGLPYVPTLVLAVILTGLIGVLIERLFYRPLTRSGGGYTVAGMGMIIAGFGMSIVLQNIAYLIWGAKPFPFSVRFGMPLEIGNISLPRSYVWIISAAVVFMAVLHFILRKTMIGLAMRAVAHNKDIAYLSGVNVPLMISVIFGIGCGLGAAAGVLIGPINYVQVLMGIGVLVKAFAAAVVGGFGSLPGAVLGGLLVGVVESLGAGYISGTYKDTYAFVLLILVLMFKPSGILGVEAKVKA
jgi:branched-chain amino acid transport system permease protein